MKQWTVPIPRPTKEWFAEKVLIDEQYVIGEFSPPKQIHVSLICFRGESSDRQVELHIGEPGGSVGIIKMTMNTTIDFGQPMLMTPRCVLKMIAGMDFDWEGTLIIAEKTRCPQ